MAFFIGVLSFNLIIWLVSWYLKKGPFQSFWVAARLALALMFTQVGIAHIIKPESLSYMIEDFVPPATLVIILTGIFEMVVPWGLLIPKFRKWTAYVLIAYLVAIFPANINVAVNGLTAPGGLPSASWYTWSRLLFQPVYIIWVWYAAFFDKKVKTMNTLTLLPLLSIFLVSFSLPQNQIYKATVQVSNIPSKGGELYIGWYSNDNGFREVSKAKYKQKVKVTNQKTITIPFDNIVPGTYAISMFLDENGNGVLDKNFFGVPAEPYGFSNNVYPAMRAATFEEASFIIQSNYEIKINLKN